MEKLSWIIGVIAGLIAIWQFFFPDLFRNKKGKQIRKETKFINKGFYNKGGRGNIYNQSLNSEKETPTAKRRMEMINWIVGTIAGLLFIWQFFFPNVFNNNLQKQNTTNLITSPKDSIHSTSYDTLKAHHDLTKSQIKFNKKMDKEQNKKETTIINKGFINQGGTKNIYNQTINEKQPDRHLTEEDINKIIKSIPDKNFKVAVFTLSNDKEVKSFAKEIYDVLISKGYTNLVNGSVEEQGREINHDKFELRKSFYGGINSLEILVSSQN